MMLALWPLGAVAQDVEHGAQVFERCAVCHQVGPDAVNAMGPVLNDVFGRRAGSTPDFPHSAGLAASGQAGLVWTPESVAQFIMRPRHFEPGTGMIFPGLKNSADVTDVIAYLETFSTDPAQLELGRTLLDDNCAGCHAIGATGDSPHETAPPFRELHLRYDVTALSEALVEGLVSGHPDMPEFTFAPEEAEAIVVYLKSLE